MGYITPGTVAAGDVATAAAWNVLTNDVISVHDSIKRLGFSTRTSDYNTSATTLAAAADIFSSSITFTADGTSSYRIELYSPVVAPGINSVLLIHLTNGSSTSLGIISYNRSGAAINYMTTHGVYYYTPSAGSITINARGLSDTGTGCTFGAGSGAANSPTPSFLAVFGPPTTI